MQWKQLATLLFVAFLAGCGATTNSKPILSFLPRLFEDPSIAPDSFEQVVKSVEPIAEQVCREQTERIPCNFKILIDERFDLQANAYQSLDASGRPIIVFTQALIDDARNADELAFVLGHEAAHHIAGHIARQQRSAVYEAVVSGIVEILRGSDREAVDLARRTGAQVGARTYSKDFELEADALGTVIAARAGYNPLRGAQFFARIPDPGDKFLGTHPPNSQRLETVRRTAAGL